VGGKVFPMNPPVEVEEEPVEEKKPVQRQKEGLNVLYMARYKTCYASEDVFL